jgi:hypothetical protein
VSDWIIENPELTGQIVALTGAVIAAGPVIWGLGVAIAFVLSPVGLLAIGIGALIAWLSTREGGLIGSLNAASVAATQLGTIAIVQLHGFVQGLSNAFRALGIDIDAVLDKIYTFMDTPVTSDEVASGWGLRMPWQEGFDPMAAIFGGRVAANQRRAGGGHANAYQATMVGEREPEMFVPSVSGEIYNQNQMGMMGGGVNMNVTIYANDYEGGRAAARGLDDQMNELMRGKGVRMAGA